MDLFIWKKPEDTLLLWAIPEGQLQCPLSSGTGSAQLLQLCSTLCDPMNCSPPGSSVHGIFQARILEWVSISYSRGSSWLRDWTCISCIAGRFFTDEPLGTDCEWSYLLLGGASCLSLIVLETDLEMVICVQEIECVLRCLWRRKSAGLGGGRG